MPRRSDRRMGHNGADSFLGKLYAWFVGCTYWHGPFSCRRRRKMPGPMIATIATIVGVGLLLIVYAKVRG